MLDLIATMLQLFSQVYGCYVAGAGEPTNWKPARLSYLVNDDPLA